uniref:Uncharacterized protein n=1 Tax=Siphoviridae sp. ctkyp1 TaxID=2825646 RepID=A0A8S5P4X1_9CAUD|nr:MAG TPA: hypothetical protein [Siphoviridae sp. ctkyp1]DAL19285.1 MAG TPA_asm: hypothetical protein [Caudoviricetes sp.]
MCFCRSHFIPSHHSILTRYHNIVIVSTSIYFRAFRNNTLS